MITRWCEDNVGRMIHTHTGAAVCLDLCTMLLCNDDSCNVGDCLPDGVYLLWPWMAMLPPQRRRI